MGEFTVCCATTKAIRRVRARRPFRAIVRDGKAVGAIEFAMTAPFLILLYIGGYQVMDATSAYRKVGMTARTMADVISQFTQVKQSDVQNAIDASRQVLNPYSVTNASTRISQIHITLAAIPEIIWSVGSGQPKLTNADVQGLQPKVMVPLAMRVPDTYLVYSEINYRYIPVAGASLLGPLTFKDQLLLNPRRSKDIPCADC